MNAMNSSPQNPSPIREEEANGFRELLEILDKFFKWLFGVIAFKTTPMGEVLFITHQNVMIVMVLMIVLYFLMQLLGTMLPQRTGIFPVILVFITMVIASALSVLVLTIISSHVAWLTLALWVAIFAVTSYYRHQELYVSVARAIKKLMIDSYNNTRTTRLPV